jgi:hypothetical protein
MLAHSRWLFPVARSRVTAGRKAAHRGIATRPMTRRSFPRRIVLAELLNLHPTTAVRWAREAGGDWNGYAAELARTRNHQPCE